MYKMAVGLMLAHPYGFTRVMSSYRWDRHFVNGKVPTGTKCTFIHAIYFIINKFMLYINVVITQSTRAATKISSNKHRIIIIIIIFVIFLFLLSFF